VFKKINIYYFFNNIYYKSMTIKLNTVNSINFIESGRSTAANSTADLRITNLSNGSTYMTITTAGNVGIGTTSPTQKLHVSGGANISDGITSGASQFSSLFITSGSLNASFNSNTIGSIITTGGNIGIGTTGPIGKLSLNLASAQQTSPGWNSSWATFGPGTSSTGSGSGNIGIGYATSNDSGFIAYSGGNLVCIAPNAAWIDMNYKANSHKFMVNNFTAPNMVISSSGQVGIGTTSPSQTLHVRSGSNNFIRIESNQNLAGEVSGIEFGVPAFSSATRSKITSTTYNADASDLKFLTGAGTDSSIVRMILATSGNVGIGTTSPAAKLHVNGNSKFGDRGSLINSIRAFTADLGQGNTGANTFTVNYGVTYPDTSKLIINVNVAVGPAVDVFGLTIREISTSSMTVNVMRLDGYGLAWGAVIKAHVQIIELT
jgi:hypothetical protein